MALEGIGRVKDFNDAVEDIEKRATNDRSFIEINRLLNIYCPSMWKGIYMPFCRFELICFIVL